MDLLYGFAGVLSLGLFAAFMGFDIREIWGNRSSAAWMDEDPNSTIGVTRDVLAEQGDAWRVTQLGAS
ncbi:MAG: hypothetical protein R2839_07425 [Thermomicrobiales bacterium]